MSRRHLFGRFEVRVEERRVLEAGEPLALGSRAFDLLVALIENRERVIGKDELMALVWPGTVVEENNLTVQVSALRKLLGSGVISTVPGRGYRFTPPQQEEPALPVAATPALPAGLPLPDRPSIAVLPFTNQGDDPQQEYFADGVTEDIITELSRFRSIFVIARNTSFAFKGPRPDVQDIARELGVHFVLEGSVRRAGQRVRITARLIDGQSGAHVWAERYEEGIDDVFDVQDSVTRQIVGTMVPEITNEEMRQADRGDRRFGQADDIAWRAYKLLTDGLSLGKAELASEAAELARQAIASDPRCRMAWLAISAAHNWRVFMGWAEDRRAELEAASRAADTLIAFDPTDSDACLARGLCRVLGGDKQRGIADVRRAYELNPNSAMTMFQLCFLEAAEGNAEQARMLATRALRNSPRDRLAGNAYLAFATNAFFAGNYAALRHWAELAIQAAPTAPIRRVLMIAYAASVGDSALLRLHREALERVAPNFIPSLFRGDYRPFHEPEQMAGLLDALREGGLDPESGPVASTRAGVFEIRRRGDGSPGAPDKQQRRDSTQ